MSKGAKLFFLGFIIICIIGFVLIFFENEGYNANYAGKKNEQPKESVYELPDHEVTELIAYFESDVFEH